MKHPSIDELTIWDLFFAVSLRHTPRNAFSEDAANAARLADAALKERAKRTPNSTPIVSNCNAIGPNAGFNCTYHMNNQHYALQINTWNGDPTSPDICENWPIVPEDDS